MQILGVHHVALICRDYLRSKAFYHEQLGLAVISEHYREARQSWKLNLGLPDGNQLELFSFPSPPPRPSQPEACGLRHLAFRVNDLDACLLQLLAANIGHEPIRIDEYTGRRFSFIRDPDDLPIELYEIPAALP